MAQRSQDRTDRGHRRGGAEVSARAASPTAIGEELRRLTDGVAERAHEAIDRIAERPVQAGALPPLTLREMCDLSAIEDRAAGRLSNREAPDELRADHEEIASALRSTIGAAEEERDYATVNLLSEILREQEEQLWILRRTLAEGRADAAL